MLNHVIDIYNWEKLLEDKNINKQLYLLNKTMLDIFHNFIPNKSMICNGRDLPWFNNQFNILIGKKSDLFNPLMHNVPKWSNTLEKSCCKCSKIFQVCLTILGQYALKAHRQIPKNGASKSIVHVIKHANFYFHSVDPDGVI